MPAAAKSFHTGVSEFFFELIEAAERRLMSSPSLLLVHRPFRALIFQKKDGWRDRRRYCARPVRMSPELNSNR